MKAAERKQRAEVWKDIAGAGYLRTCIAIFALLLLFSVIFAYAKQVTLVENVRKNVRKALDGMAMKSAEASYSEENEGKNVTFVWDEAQFFSYLSSFFPGVEQTEDGYRYITGDSTLVWELSRPTVSVREDGELHLTAEYVMTLPMYFGGMQFPDIDVPIRVESGRMWK